MPSTTVNPGQVRNVSPGTILGRQSPGTGRGEQLTPAQARDVLSVYSTADVDNAIAALVDSAPETLDTLDELADALGDDPNFAVSMATALAGKAPLVHSHNASGLDAESVEESKLDILNSPTDTFILSFDTASGRMKWVEQSSGGLSGDVSATDNVVVRSDGTGGDTVQGSGVTIDDTDNMTTPGTVQLTSAGIPLKFTYSGMLYADFYFLWSGSTRLYLYRQWAGAKKLLVLCRDNGYVGFGVDNPTEKIDVAGSVKCSDGFIFPTFTDATRGAAGKQGRTIFNSDDGQLNIDNGTDWTLPDGTTT